jgi:hypothetical protein
LTNFTSRLNAKFTENLLPNIRLTTISKWKNTCTKINVHFAIYHYKNQMYIPNHPKPNWKHCCEIKTQLTIAVYKLKIQN